MDTPTRSITLFCWILDVSESFFLVEIDNSKTVGHLKEAILNKKSTTFANVEADNLTLWKVSIPTAGDLKNKVAKGNYNDDDALSDEWALWNVFTPPEPTEETFHIVIRSTLVGGKKRKTDAVPELDDFEQAKKAKLTPIVQSPLYGPQLDQLFELNCFVPGDDPNSIFTVKIAKTENVSILRDAIKEERKPEFDHIRADTLRLWKVSILIDDDNDERFKEDVGKLELRREEALRPLKKLDVIFDDQPDDKYLHIIVKRPENNLPPATQEEGGDVITTMKTRFTNTIRKILTAKVPSEASAYQEYQRNFPIYDGLYDVECPVETAAPPVELFEPAFAHFLHDVANNTVVYPEVVRATVKYMRAASGIYSTGDDRSKAIRPLLCEILGMGLSKVINSDRMTPDGIIEVTTGSELSAILLVEEKKDLETGDVSIQCGLSMARYWAQPNHRIVRNNTRCPTFLVATAGPWFAVLGAVFTDKVIVQRLTDYIWVGMGATLNEELCYRVGVIMQSLRTGVRKLREYYEGFQVPAVPGSEIHPRYFPSICSYHDQRGGLMEFHYVKPLEDEATCVTFLAHLDTELPDTESPRLVVVKFVTRYGEDAHRLLAKDNRAPKLLHIGKVGVEGDDSKYGSLRMVVMDYVDGMTLDNAWANGPVPVLAKKGLMDAIELLHSGGFVFGDLRAPNVMITKNEGVMLIDFDWAGVDKKDQYPALISPVIKWPDGVEGLGVMEKQHDMVMLEWLVEKYLGV